MTVVGLDDTDSRTRGMCTTYVATRIAERLERAGTVERLVLLRCNPAVAHKTRGNAALAIHAECDPAVAFEAARAELEALSETGDDATNPGLVVADCDPDAVSDRARTFARKAVRDHHEIADAAALIDARGYRSWWAGNGRGRIGALAAVGGWAALADPTYEYVAYREPDRWGTPREVDDGSVLAAATAGYPGAWDTVDREAGETVCVPHTPGPVLYGVRGDDPDAVRAVAAGIESEPVDRDRLYVTNQGTDAHLRTAPLADVRDGRAYRVDGTVASAPETRRGGHVFFSIEDGNDDTAVAAFEPTKRFRDRVRALRPGDRITACGEVAGGTLKLEKFAVRELVRTERATPTCPDCERTMESAGRNQGYRCRDCGTDADGTERVPVARDLEEGWYEVPPRARRHVAKPLVRGGFDAPIHPER